jgi:hypothetical protein
MNIDRKEAKKVFDLSLRGHLKKPTERELELLVDFVELLWGVAKGDFVCSKCKRKYTLIDFNKLKDQHE